MQNISIDFFGEKITTIMPIDLASLRSIIVEQFMFSPDDAAEVIITYMKDLGKKIIETEEDFKEFLNGNINLISLDISQDSKLYKENFASIEKENNENINELDNLNKKKEEIISEKRNAVKEFNKTVKSIDEQIKKLQTEIKKEKNKMKNEINKLDKEEIEINKKIQDLKEKLGIKNDENETIKKVEEKREQEKEKEKSEQEKKNSTDIKEKKSAKKQEIEKLVEKKEDKIEDKKEENKENKPFINFKPITDVINMFGAFFQKDKPIHFSIVCNGCGAFPIIGNRFKCTVCENFNYCENCEEKFGNEHQHPFLKIYCPSQNPVDIKYIPNEGKI